MIGLLWLAAGWGVALGGFVFALWRLRKSIAAFTRRIDEQSEEWRS